MSVLEVRGNSPPPIDGVVAKDVHEGYLRSTLNDIGWYAKECDLTAEQLSEIFEARVIAVVQDRPDEFGFLWAKRQRV